MAKVEIRPSASYSFTVRVQIPQRPGSFARIAMAIGDSGGGLDAVDIVDSNDDFCVRDVTVNASSSEHSKQIIKAIKKLKGIKIISVSDKTFLMHLGGKLEIISKFPLNTRNALSMAYTPGVARVCESIHEDKERVFNLTIKKNTVAVITDGTAVLGLGDIGPEAALPVMEGKCMLFKEFAGVDAFPLALSTKDTEEIIDTVIHLSPVFGGINLEDISAPRCFEIERRLQKELDIPVFHDDQHGTAVVVLAALINAMKIVRKDMEKISVVISGAGAAGIACCNIIMRAGVKNVILCDRAGAIYEGRKENMNSMKTSLARKTNPDKVKGHLKKVLRGADVFIGVSGPGVLSAGDVKKMAKDPIVFAMSNPVPEVMPEAIEKIARVIGTGRSDYPNQINNVLCFPGLFKGALRCKAKRITERMKLSAAKAIAGVIPPNQLNEEYIIPSVFNSDVANKVADAVEKEAVRSGVARSKSRVLTT